MCVCVHVAWLVDTGGCAIDVEHTLSPHSLISGHFTLLCVFIYLPIITLTLTLTAFEWITLIWPLYCVSPALVCFHVAPYSHGGIGGGGVREGKQKCCLLSMWLWSATANTYNWLSICFNWNSFIKFWICSKLALSKTERFNHLRPICNVLRAGTRRF